MIIVFLCKNAILQDFFFPGRLCLAILFVFVLKTYLSERVCAQEGRGRGRGRENPGKDREAAFLNVIRKA